MAKSNSKKSKKIEATEEKQTLDELKETLKTEEPTETTKGEPASYYKCACGHEDFQQVEEVTCPECNAFLPILEKVYCECCESEFYISGNIVNCPGCDERIRSIKESLENTGVIPTDDEEKAKRIVAEKKDKLLVESAGLFLREARLLSNINAQGSVENILHDSKDLYISILDDIEEEQNPDLTKKLKTAANTELKKINAALLILDCIKFNKLALDSVKNQIKSNQNAYDNAQLPLDLNKAQEIQELPLDKDRESSKEIAMAGGIEEDVFDGLEEEFNESEEPEEVLI